MTLFITHFACLEPLTPLGHPERPERLRAIDQVIEHEKFMFLLREQCSRAGLEIIAFSWSSLVPNVGQWSGSTRRT